MFPETFATIRDPGAKTQVRSKFGDSYFDEICWKFWTGRGGIGIDIFPRKTFPLIRGEESELNTNDAPLCGVLNNTQLSGEIACER